MENEQLQKILRKLNAYQANPELVREPSLAEMTSLVVLVLNQVKVIEKAIKEGRLDGKTPEADKDYISKETMLEMLTESVNSLKNDTDKETKAKIKELDSAVQNALAQIKDGQDAVISPEQIAEAAAIASSLIELPEVSEAITASPEAIRDALELLQGDDKLSIEAIKDLPERLADLQKSLKKDMGQFIGGGVSEKRILQLIAQNAGGGTFLSLEDTPNSLAGEALKVVQVNAGETALEFVTLAGGGDALVANPLSQFAATTSAQLAGVLTDETGSGAAVFGTSPTLTGATMAGDLDLNGQDIVDGTTFKYDSANSRISVGSTENTISIAGATALGVQYSSSTEGATDLVDFFSHRHSDIVAIGTHMLTGRSRGTHASPSAVQSGDKLSLIAATGFDGTDWELAASIDTEVDGTPGANDMPGRLIFKTTPDGSNTPVEAMRISQDKAVTMAGTLGVTGAASASNLSGTNTGDEDTASITALGALMDSEVTNLAQVKAFDTTDYATAAQGTTADAALPKAGGTMTGDINMGSGDVTALDNLQFDTTPTTPLTAEGSVYYDSTNKCLAVKNDEVECTLQVGQENWIRVYNDSGGTISNGEVVYVTGKEDVQDRLTIGLAQADAANTSKVIGFATHDIETASFGYITQFGYVNDINTSSFADGASIWLSDTVAGGIVGTAPQSPSDAVFLGYVVDSAVSGNIFITTLGNTSGDTIASDAEQVVTPGRKGTAGTINKGQPVYITGYNIGQSAVEVELADASAGSTMSAIGIANDSITNSTNGNITISGRVANIDTSAFTVNDTLYVSETAGVLTATKPTGTALIQAVAKVVRVNASTGVIEVIGAGRTNDLPNIANTKIWIGDSNGVPQEFALSGDATMTAGGAVTVASASTTVAGKVELATDAEMTTGTDTSRAITPANAKVELDKKLALAGGTMTGAITLGEDTSIAIDPSISADASYTGITVAGTGGATIAIGDVIYLDVTAGEWLLADASAKATAGDVCIGIAASTSTDGNPVTVLLSGTMRAATFPASIALGAPVYISETAGDLTATQPTTTDSVIRVLGWAVTVEPNTIYFNPSPDYIEHV